MEYLSAKLTNGAKETCPFPRLHLKPLGYLHRVGPVGLVINAAFPSFFSARTNNTPKGQRLGNPQERASHGDPKQTLSC